LEFNMIWDSFLSGCWCVILLSKCDWQFCCNVCNIISEETRHCFVWFVAM